MYLLLEVLGTWWPGRLQCWHQAGGSWWELVGADGSWLRSGAQRPGQATCAFPGGWENGEGDLGKAESWSWASQAKTGL